MTTNQSGELKRIEILETNDKTVAPIRTRKYLPTFAELVDRLSIVQLKEVFIPEHRDEYSKEIQDILHDINIILKENNINLTAETIRAIIIVSQYNLHIWHNESNFRKGIKDGNNLELTHGLNSIRNFSKNIIQEIIGGRKDYKLDSVKAFSKWVPSQYEKGYEKETNSNGNLSDKE